MKQDRTQRHACMINSDGTVGMQNYFIKEGLTKKRTALGNVSYDKQLDWT